MRRACARRVPLDAPSDLVDSPARPKPSQFTATHWSVVLAAGQMPSAPANAALEELCETYWHPL